MEDLHKFKTKSASPFSLSRVLVFDVVCNVWKRDSYEVIENLPEDSEELKKITDKIKPPISFDVRDIARAPRNSILGYPIGSSARVSINSEEAENDTKLSLYYPFFSSHLSMPVKPGEHVFVMHTENPKYGYWLSRITEHLEVEDANYTHADRRYIDFGPPDKDQEKDSKIRKPSFMNGSAIATSDPESIKSAEDLTADEDNQLQLSDIFGYESIFNENHEINSFVIEPVPRLTKRPGDLVLQGSHNSAIVLGTDRGYGSKNRPTEDSSNSFLEKQMPARMGSIDIVVGRGRLSNAADDPKEGSGKEQNALTRPRVIKNARDFFETDKDPSTDASHEKLENRPIDIPEGDPDFINDSARLYISMNGDVDEKLGILPEAIPSLISEDLLASEDAGSSASVKADKVRIVSRNTGTKNISEHEHKDVTVDYGDIRIIKQGNSDSNACSIYLLKDGTVQISGSKIFFGRSKKNGQTSSDYGSNGPGPGGSQPYVRFSDLKKLFEEMFSAIDKFTDTMPTHVTPGNGAPSPQILQASAELKAELTKIKSSVGNFDKLASERVFGE